MSDRITTCVIICVPLCYSLCAYDIVFIQLHYYFETYLKTAEKVMGLYTICIAVKSSRSGCNAGAYVLVDTVIDTGWLCGTSSSGMEASFLKR